MLTVTLGSSPLLGLVAPEVMLLEEWAGLRSWSVQVSVGLYVDGLWMPCNPSPLHCPMQCCSLKKLTLFRTSAFLVVVELKNLLNSLRGGDSRALTPLSFGAVGVSAHKPGHLCAIWAPQGQSRAPYGCPIRLSISGVTSSAGDHAPCAWHGTPLAVVPRSKSRCVWQRGHAVPKGWARACSDATHDPSTKFTD